MKKRANFKLKIRQYRNALVTLALKSCQSARRKLFCNTRHCESKTKKFSQRFFPKHPFSYFYFAHSNSSSTRPEATIIYWKLRRGAFVCARTPPPSHVSSSPFAAGWKWLAWGKRLRKIPVCVPYSSSYRILLVSWIQLGSWSFFDAKRVFLVG